MALTTKECNARINGLLTDLVELGDYLIVEDDNRIVWQDNPDTPIQLTIGTGKSAQKKTLYMYDVNIKDPDAVLLNPINEGPVMSKDRGWFYQVVFNLFVSEFCRVMEKIVETSIAAKTDQSALKEPIIAHLLAPVINEVDAKMLDEVKRITAPDYRKYVIYQHYNKKTCTCSLYTCFQDEEQTLMKAFPDGKIRKKFWKFLELLFQEIFSKENVSSKDPIYTSSVAEDTPTVCPLFRTYSDVLVFGWDKIAPFLTLRYGGDATDKTIERVSRCQTNLKDILQFYKACLWTGDGSVHPEETREDRPEPKLDIPSRTSRVSHGNARFDTKSTPSTLDVLEARGGLHRRRYSLLESGSFRQQEDDIPEWRAKLREMRMEPRRGSRFFDDDRYYRDDDDFFAPRRRRSEVPW